jgi:hypothetical protein
MLFHGSAADELLLRKETAGYSLEAIDQLFSELDTLRITNKHVRADLPVKDDLEENDTTILDDKASS